MIFHCLIGYDSQYFNINIFESQWEVQKQMNNLFASFDLNIWDFTDNGVIGKIMHQGWYGRIQNKRYQKEKGKGTDNAYGSQH